MSTTNWLVKFSEEYNRNIEGAKFKIGDSVYIFIDEHWLTRKYVVTAVNHLSNDEETGKKIFEYAVDSTDYIKLFWEDELSFESNGRE